MLAEQAHLVLRGEVDALARGRRLQPAGERLVRQGGAGEDLAELLVGGAELAGERVPEAPQELLRELRALLAEAGE